jgi:chaperonin GroES
MFSNMATSKKKSSKQKPKKAVIKGKKAKTPAKKILKEKSPVSTFPIQPLGDRVIIKEVTDVAEKTASGIFLPESAQDKETKKGKVVAVGPGRYEDGNLVPMSVKVGDMVIYGWGDKVKLDGTDYVIVRENEVTAVLK